MDNDGAFARISSITLFLTLLLCAGQSQAQVDCEPYGTKIFELLISSDQGIKEEFIDLIEYQSYVDRLSMPEEKKENLKEHALNNYMELKKNFINEANRIITFYEKFKGQGVVFTYQYCTHDKNPKYPGIGFIELFYIAEENGEVTDDSISFECIYTANGWRIIDGFYQENP